MSAAAAAPAATATTTPTAPAAPRLFGVLAAFASAAELKQACVAVRDAGFTCWDAHSPFPVHGLDTAMGLRPSRLPIAVLVGGLGGAALAMFFQYWVSVVDYPLVISGKPLFSYPAFVPITFEIGVLLGVVGGLLAMFHLNRLPRWHHPLFQSRLFERVTDDLFFVSIEAVDPKFERDATATLLRTLGAWRVELVEDTP